MVQLRQQLFKIHSNFLIVSSIYGPNLNSASRNPSMSKVCRLAKKFRTLAKNISLKIRKKLEVSENKKIDQNMPLDT